MRNSAVLVFLVVFSALAFYYFFAEDVCPVHNVVPRGSFSHVHRGAPSVCLCFWNTLFTTAAYEFVVLQDVETLPPPGPGLRPAGPFGYDIGRPPKAFPA